jgi:hypothetical protein
MPCSVSPSGAEVTITAPDLPGVYGLFTPGGRRADIVVQTDPAESSLEKIQRTDIEAATGASRRSALASFLAPATADGTGPSMSSWLLLAAALALAVEQWLTRRR